jgi:hypothetical protein
MKRCLIKKEKNSNVFDRWAGIFCTVTEIRTTKNIIALTFMPFMNRTIDILVRDRQDASK